MKKDNTISCDVAVIGSGLAGNATTLFAVQKNLNTVQVGHASELIYASGLIDLLGIHPVATQQEWRHPYEAIRNLAMDCPRHPYARIPEEDIREALASFLHYLALKGLPYVFREDRNVSMLTPLGTTKLTYAVPHTMSAGVQSLYTTTPCLLVNIRNLKGFSARQIQAVMGRKWPGLRSAEIDLAERTTKGELYAEALARSLDRHIMRDLLVRKLAPLLKGAQAVGLPAVLGIYRSSEVVDHLQQALGVAVFEIPTMPPAVPGLRLKELFERHLTGDGVTRFLQHRVTRARSDRKGPFILEITGPGVAERVRANRVILATGRFVGGGLYADRTGVREPLFDLPVHQPSERSLWHRKSFVDPRGHRINQAGIETDSHFRPLAGDGQLVHPGLYAAGSILAHQDWMRMKCGGGLAICTAFAAAHACAASL
jgi:glycerol-3-phosphate dehydrogenase subunit B